MRTNGEGTNFFNQAFKLPLHRCMFCVTVILYSRTSRKEQGEVDLRT